MIQDERLLENLRYNLGDTIMNALGEDSVVEIDVNEDGKIWIEHLGEDMMYAGDLDASQARMVINLVASSLEAPVSVERPFVEGELVLDGSRFEGTLPPIVAAPSFAIRKRASRIFCLEEYVTDGIMPEYLVETFRDLVRQRKNILVVGGTGSGKTTFVNALIKEIASLCPKHRLLILQDTLELQSESENREFLRTSDHVSMNRLLSICMRKRPDRIIIGEVRDGSALDLLKAWNTGHEGGIATIHANSALEGLTRLEELVGEATIADKSPLIGRSIDVVIYLERAPRIGRRIREVMRVMKYDSSARQYVTQPIYSMEEQEDEEK